jgi:hypothetical protein
MKKAVWILGIVIITFIGYVAATPYITISNIKTSVVEQDSEKLSKNVDFPIFRQNLKKQFNTAMMKNVGAELQNNPFAAIAAGFATNMVDGVVDSFVTPSGLAMLMEGKKPSLSRSMRRNPSNTDQANRDDLFKNARYSYDSLNQFSIYVPTDTGDEIRFILQRDGLSWKLVDMIVPI